MNRNGLFILNCLCLLFALPRCLLLAVRGESSFLNDAELIKNKIPGFIESVSKNGLELSEDDLEKVSEKCDRVGTAHSMRYQADPIVLPTRNRIPIKSLDGFDVAKVATLNEEIEDRFDEIREKIDKLKDLALQYNEEVADSTPLLEFPTKFDQTSPDAEGGESSQQPSVDAKTKSWIKCLDLDDEQQCASALPSANTASKSPVRTGSLANRRTTLPNWKGSARHLVRGGTIKDELLSQLDDEGRSIAPELEKMDKAPVHGEPSERHPRERSGSVRADPEEMSAQENRLNSKLILTNEIPCGEAMAGDDFQYGGEKFSNSKRRQGSDALLSSPEKIEYINFEDVRDEEPKGYFEEKRKTSKARKARNKQKKKTKSRYAIEKRDFSPPEPLDPLPRPVPEKVLSPTPIALSVPGKFRDSKNTSFKRNSKEGFKHGYEDLQFELSESMQPCPMLPSIESDGAKTRSFPMKRNEMSPEPEKMLKRKEEPKGYSELPDLSEEVPVQDEPADAKVVDLAQYLQIVPRAMPKRGKKKLPSGFVSPSRTFGAPDAKPLSAVGKTQIQACKKAPHFDASKTLGKLESELFDKSPTIGPGGFSPTQNMGDLMCTKTSGQKIEVPESNLPKRKNK